MQKILLALAVSIFAISLCPGAVFAADNQFSISVQPSEQSIELVSGEEYSGSISFYNIGPSAIDIAVSAQPYSVINETYTPDFTSNDARTALASWFTFENDFYHVEPNTAAVINYHISVPETSLSGGQYAAIVLRNVTNKSNSGASLNIAAQIASIVYGHINSADAHYAGELLKLSFPNFVTRGKFKVSAIFKNQGNIDYLVRETITIRDVFSNQEVISPKIKDKQGRILGLTEANILPDTRRTIEFEWPDSPNLGVYQVTVNFAYLDQTQTTTKIVIFCPLWLIICLSSMFILLVLFVISFIIRKHRSRTRVF